MKIIMRIKLSNTLTLLAGLFFSLFCFLASAQAGDGKDFPVSVTHSKGEIVVNRKPQRIVAVGYSDLAIAHALGANIVGAMQYHPGADSRNFPWVQPPLPASLTTLSAGSADLEQIRELEPDLILAATAYHSYEENYQALSEIAPTLVYVQYFLRDDGDELTRIIGRLLGESEKAEQLIAASHAQQARFAEEHRDWAGKTLAYVLITPDTLHPVTDSDTPALKLFRNVGLQQPFGLRELVGPYACNGSTTSDIEDASPVFSADYVLIGAYGYPDAKTVFQQLEENRAILQSSQPNIHFAETALYDSLVAPNPVNTRYTLDRLHTVLTQSSSR